MPNRTRNKRNLDDGKARECSLAVDRDEMLNLRQAGNLFCWFFVEFDLDRAGFERLDGSRERGEGLGNLIAKV